MTITAIADRRYQFVWLVYVCLLSTIVGCSGVRFISDYDEETDRGLSSIQVKVDGFIEKLISESGTEAASYKSNQSFYDAIDDDLRRLEFRVSSIPDNQRTVDLIDNIRTVILSSSDDAGNQSLQDLHRMHRDPDHGPSPTVLETSRRIINQTISAALSLELAKKRGME